MSGPLATGACLLGLGCPMLVLAHRARRTGADLFETVAAALGGLGVAIIGVWWSTSLLGLGFSGIAVGPLLLTATVATYPRAGHVTPEETSDRVRRGMIALILVFVLATLVPFLPHGVERGDGVHRMSMTDWEKHLLFTTEMAAGDAFPPANPFLRSSGPSPYYAGFHLAAAVVARALGGPGASLTALLLLLVVTAAGVPVVAFVLSRGLTGSAIRGLVGASLATLLGGLDMLVLGLATVRDTWKAWPLPGGFAGLRAVIPSVNPDFWIHHNERQFYPPYRATIWAPQHVLAALLALLAIHRLQVRRPRRQGDWLICGLLLAGTAATSAYVGLAAAIWLAGSFVADLLAARRTPWNSDLWPDWPLAGVTALFAGLPLLTQFSGASGADLTLHVSAAGGAINGALATAVAGDAQWTRLLDSPALLVLELGLVGLLGSLTLWRHHRQGRDRNATALAVAAGAVLLTVVLLRPPVDGPNNLYGRGPLLVWFVFAALAAEFIMTSRGGLLRRLGLLICALYLPYAMVGATVEGWVFWPTPAADHAAARWIAENTPSDAIVAYAPGDGPRDFSYWSRRRIAVGDRRLAELFGATERQFTTAATTLTTALGAPTRSDAAAALRRLGATWLIYVPDRTGFGTEPDGACLADRHRSGRWVLAEVGPPSCG